MTTTIRHEDTAEHWRANARDQKRKKQHVSALLRAALGELRVIAEECAHSHDEGSEGSFDPGCGRCRAGLFLVERDRTEAAPIVHRTPNGIDGIMPCCGQTLAQVPSGEWITSTPAWVTCGGGYRE